jgi:hypothetical protein
MHQLPLHHRFHLTAILMIACAAFALPALAQARQIHYFRVFCDAYPGKGGAINESVSVDRMSLDSLFAENVNEQSWGITQRKMDISGVEATGENVNRQWQEFTKGIQKEDTVFVYFSGHGGIPDGAADNILLQMCDLTMVSRRDWAKSIEELPCKLKIFITDCCSTYMDYELAEGDEEVEPWKTLYYLLLKHEGFVNITAASPGQAALGTKNGGFLTINLISDMMRYRTWAQVFREASARVHLEVVHELRKGGQPVEDAQRPFSYSLATPLFEQGDQTAPDNRNDYVIADSNLRQLTQAELEPLGLQQLYFARNEIFARHGFDFSTPLLKFYFSSKTWYEARAGFKNPSLSALESRNSDLILSVERAKGGPFVAGRITLPGQAAAAPPDIFVYSSNHLLTRSAMEKMTLKELSIARNEIYARHGFPFKSKVLQQFFATKPYYRRAHSTAEPAFNPIERQNLWLIRKMERIKGGPHQW